MVDIPEREIWLHQNPDAKSMLEAGLAEMARGETVAVDLSGFPEDDEEPVSEAITVVATTPHP